MTSRPVVIGVGNPTRRDDGVGWAVATAAGCRLGDTVDVRWCDGEPARLLDAWADRELAVVVDAVRSDARPGTVCVLSASEAELVRSTGRPGTHALGVGEAMALGRALDWLPGRLVVVGIGTEDHGVGDGLSDCVAAAVDGAVDLVCRLVTEPSAANRSSRSWALDDRGRVLEAWA